MDLHKIMALIPTKQILLISDMQADNLALTQTFAERGYDTCECDISNDSLIDQLPHLPPKAIILQMQDYGANITDIIAHVKQVYPDMNLPVLALSHAAYIEELACVDSTILAPYHPAQIVLRISSLLRLAEMEQEIGLRLQTLQQDFNITPDIPAQNTHTRFKILFIGNASPEFMIIINALQKKHVNVVAAFTSFTAFDYLYEQTFDAVVMNGLRSNEPAFSVTQTMRKNAKLYHVPTLLLINTNNFTQQDTAYQAGINDIIDAKSSLEEISSRILEQANFHRTHENLKQVFNTLGGEACIDPLTRHYNQRFFNAHLTRVRQFYRNLDLPISLCLIRVRANVKTTTPDALRGVYQHIGNMISNLIRLQDITARLDDNIFVIAFPGQSMTQLQSVVERITSILQSAMINDINTGEPLDVDLEIKFSQLDDDIHVQQVRA